jgi:hypothetical protein
LQIELPIAGLSMTGTEPLLLISHKPVSPKGLGFTDFFEGWLNTQATDLEKGVSSY